MSNTFPIASSASGSPTWRISSRKALVHLSAAIDDLLLLELKPKRKLQLPRTGNRPSNLTDLGVDRSRRVQEHVPVCEIGNREICMIEKVENFKSELKTVP